MPSTIVNVKVAISRTNRWPYYKARVLGRGNSQPGELVVPLALTIDNALLRRETVTVNIEIPTPDKPTVTIE